VLGLSADAFVLADDRRGRYLPVDEPGALRAAGERDPAVLADIARTVHPRSPCPFGDDLAYHHLSSASRGVGKAAGYRWCTDFTV
jgi:hypothetical protein